MRDELSGVTINVGVSQVAAIRELAGSGARRFFAGLGQLNGSNMRPQTASFQAGDVESILMMMEECQSQNCEFSFLLNSVMLPSAVEEPAIAVLSELVSAGLRLVVVSNLGLMRRLIGEMRDLSIIASIGAMAGSLSGARLLRNQFGVNEIVVDRQTRLDTIAALVDDGFRVEAVVMYDKCSFYDASCSLHKFRMGDRGEVGECACPQPTTGSNLRRYDIPGCDPDGCSGCSLVALLSAGVKVLKIASRGKSINQVRLAIDFVEAVLEEGSGSPDFSRRSYSRVFGRSCCSGSCVVYV